MTAVNTNLRPKLITFSGRPAYTKAKLRDLHSRGWAIIKSRKWPDGSESFTMEYVGKK